MCYLVGYVFEIFVGFCVLDFVWWWGFVEKWVWFGLNLKLDGFIDVFYGGLIYVIWIWLDNLIVCFVFVICFFFLCYFIVLVVFFDIILFGLCIVLFSLVFFQVVILYLFNVNYLFVWMII